jgi:hypothetical protein
MPFGLVSSEQMMTIGVRIRVEKFMRSPWDSAADGVAVDDGSEDTQPVFGWNERWTGTVLLLVARQVRQIRMARLR